MRTTAKPKRAEKEEAAQPQYRVADYPVHYLAAVQKQHQMNVARALKPMGLTAQMWRVLAVLTDYGKCNISHLADMTVLDRTALGRLLESMEGGGLVRRALGSDGDRRATLIELTQAGTETYRRALPHVLRLTTVLLEGISPSDFESLIRTLRRLKANAQAASSILF